MSNPIQCIDELQVQKNAVLGKPISIPLNINTRNRMIGVLIDNGYQATSYELLGKITIYPCDGSLCWQDFEKP